MRFARRRLVRRGGRRAPGRYLVYLGLGLILLSVVMAGVSDEEREYEAFGQRADAVVVARGAQRGRWVDVAFRFVTRGGTVVEGTRRVHRDLAETLAPGEPVGIEYLDTAPARFRFAGEGVSPGGASIAAWLLVGAGVIALASGAVRKIREGRERGAA